MTGTVAPFIHGTLYFPTIEHVTAALPVLGYDDDVSYMSAGSDILDLAGEYLANALRVPGGMSVEMAGPSDNYASKITITSRPNVWSGSDGYTSQSVLDGLALSGAQGYFEFDFPGETVDYSRHSPGTPVRPATRSVITLTESGALVTQAPSTRGVFGDPWCEGIEGLRRVVMIHRTAEELQEELAELLRQREALFTMPTLVDLDSRIRTVEFLLGEDDCS